MNIMKIIRAAQAAILSLGLAVSTLGCSAPLDDTKTLSPRYNQTARQAAPFDLTQKLYLSTVMITDELGMGTGFCIGHFIDPVNRRKVSVIATAGHVVFDRVRNFRCETVEVSYWSGSGRWRKAKGSVAYAVNDGVGQPGDVALVLLPGVDVPDLDLAQETPSKDVEVLASGCSLALSPPAIVSFGGVRPRNDLYFLTNALATYGESGGPVVRKSDGLVVGMIAHAPAGHTEDAGLTGCPSRSILAKALAEAGFKD